MGKGWLLIYYLNAWEDLKYYNVYLVTLLTKTSSSYATMLSLLLLLYLKKSFSACKVADVTEKEESDLDFPSIFSCLFSDWR